MRNAFLRAQQPIFKYYVYAGTKSEPTENDLRRMNLINKELERFIENYKLKYLI